jgi:hypothetical protein
VPSYSGKKIGCIPGKLGNKRPVLAIQRQHDAHILDCSVWLPNGFVRLWAFGEGGRVFTLSRWFSSYNNLLEQEVHNMLVVAENPVVLPTHVHLSERTDMPSAFLSLLVSEGDGGQPQCGEHGRNIGDQFLVGIESQLLGIRMYEEYITFRTVTSERPPQSNKCSCYQVSKSLHSCASLLSTPSPPYPLSCCERTNFLHRYELFPSVGGTIVQPISDGPAPPASPPGSIYVYITDRILEHLFLYQALPVILPSVRKS